jgi:hypothetical protein
MRALGSDAGARDVDEALAFMSSTPRHAATATAAAETAGA